MSIGRLGQHKSSGSGTYSVYEVPAGKVFKGNVSVVNNAGTTAKVYLYISPTSTPANDYMIQNDSITVSVSGYERTALVAKAGEWICYKTDQAGVNVVLYGELENTSSDDFSSTSLITTNTDTTVYPNVSAKAGVFNVSVSVTEGATSDLCTVELYSTTTNVAGGYLLQKETIRGAGTTGFERSGLALTTSDKLIIRTTGISGQIAVRVHGYTEG